MRRYEPIITLCLVTAHCAECQALPPEQPLPPPPEGQDRKSYSDDQDRHSYTVNNPGVDEKPDKPRGNLAPAMARLRERLKLQEVDPSIPPDEEGERVSDFDGGPWCEVCKGMRYVRRDLPVEDPDFGKTVDCPLCSRGIIMQRRLNRLWGELDEKLQEHTLDNFETNTKLRRTALERCREWLAQDKQRWLYIDGPVGIGKTHLAVGVTKAWIELGHSGVFKLSRDLLDRIRQGYDDKSYQDVMDSLGKVELLVLDDLGSERHKESGDDDWASEKLFQIMNGRYEKNARTLITSN